MVVWKVYSYCHRQLWNVKYSNITMDHYVLGHTVENINCRRCYFSLPSQLLLLYEEKMVRCAGNLNQRRQKIMIHMKNREGLSACLKAGDPLVY